jgi:hypothetical protein
MVDIHRTAHKSTRGRLTIRQLAPCSTPCQQEESVEPQQEEPVEPQPKESIEPQEEQPAEPEEDAIHSQGDSIDPLDYTLLSNPDDSDSEPELVRVATEFHSFGKESLTAPA